MEVKALEEGYTTLSIKVSTKRELKKLREEVKGTYDDVIKKLIAFWREHKDECG